MNQEGSIYQNVRNRRKFTCTICQSDVKLREGVGILHCGHKFHVCCLIRLLSCSNICPLCRCDIKGPCNS